LSNISLAYTVPSELAHKWKLEGLKAYVNVVNSAVFSSWKFFDPEYHGAGVSTLPSNQTPVPITINFGLNLTL
jgi:hypothetical protein